VANDDRKPSALPKRSRYLYSSKIDDGRCIHRPGKINTVFVTFSTSTAKKGKCTHKLGITPAENVCPTVYLCSRSGTRFLTESHIKLDILVDMQEPFYDSHHKIAFDYDEDTLSFVEEPTLATLDVSLSDNSDSSAGNASTALEYYCYEIEADTTQF
jgi:hypothetical protein